MLIFQISTKDWLKSKVDQAKSTSEVKMSVKISYETLTEWSKVLSIKSIRLFQIKVVISNYFKERELRLRSLSRHKSTSKFIVKDKLLLQAYSSITTRNQRTILRFGDRLLTPCLQALTICTWRKRNLSFKSGPKARNENSQMNSYIWHFTQTKEFL